MCKKLSTFFLLLSLCAMANATVYTWNGNTSSAWGTDSNWTPSTGVPGSGDDVIIPAGSMTYPVLKEADNATCHYIYFEVVFTNGVETTSSARIKNQHLLTYEKAFCDVSVTCNRWVRTAAPLKNVFSGDYFVQHQTLDQRAWHGSEYSAHGEVVNGPVDNWRFIEAEYKYSEKSENPTNYVNRSRKGTYYSYFSTNQVVKLAKEDENGIDSINTFYSQWGDPSNSLKTPIEPGMGFDVWVNYGSLHYGDAVTFRFPSQTGWYAYFGDGGYISPRAGESYDRDEAHGQGRFALEYGTDGKMHVHLNREGQGFQSPMFAVGNPAFAYLDIAQFLRENSALGYILPYVYTHNEENPDSEAGKDGRGSEDVYYYDRSVGVSGTLYRIKEGYAIPEDGDNIPEKKDKVVVPKSDRKAYINPAEGFRIMGGGVAYKVDVPELVGVYAKAKFTVAQPIRTLYYDGNSLKTNGGLSSYEIDMLSKENVEFDYSITVVPNHSDQVRINNFLNLGSVVATISKTTATTGTLTITQGSPMMSVFKGTTNDDTNNDKWSFEDNKTGDTNVPGAAYKSYYASGTSGRTYSTTEHANTTATASQSAYTYRMLKIYGTTDSSISLHNTEHQVYSGVKARNVSNTNTCDVVLDYEITTSGIEISLHDGMKIFFQSDAVKNNKSVKPAYHHSPNTYSSGRLCEAWFAFDEMTSVKNNPEKEPGKEFIMEDEQMEGEFSAYVRQNIGNINLGIVYGNYSDNGKKIKINRVLGSYNVVGIKGLYPGDNTTPVLGQISKIYPPKDGSMNISSSNLNGKGANNGGSYSTGDQHISVDFSGIYGNSSDFTNMYSGAAIHISGATITKVVITGYQTGSGNNKRYYVKEWKGNGVSLTGNRASRTWTGSTDELTIELQGTETAQITSIAISYSYPDYSSNPSYHIDIPAGQLAHISGSDPNPANDHYLYAHGNAAVRMKTIEMTWDASNKYWKFSGAKTSNTGCYEVMVARQGTQPLISAIWFDGLILGDMSSSENRFYLRQKNTNTDSESLTPVETEQADASYIKYIYMPNMFQANIAAAAAGSEAPKRINGVVAGEPVVITAVSGNVAANTMIIRSDGATDDFKMKEDAPIFDLSSYALALGTLAGSNVVAVNSIASAELIPLFMSQSATLTFENISTLGEAYLYDAVMDTRVQITNNTPYVLVIEEGQQAGRYFIETDIEAPEQTTDVENVVTYDWRAVAYCPAEGALAVACAAEGVSFEVYNVSGQKIAQAAESTTFNGLHNGVYVVNATRGSENQTIKVIVY